jgi:hypothetical protein
MDATIEMFKSVIKSANTNDKNIPISLIAETLSPDHGSKKKNTAPAHTEMIVGANLQKIVLILLSEKCYDGLLSSKILLFYHFWVEFSLVLEITLLLKFYLIKYGQ